MMSVVYESPVLAEPSTVIELNTVEGLFLYASTAFEGD